MISALSSSLEPGLGHHKRIDECACSMLQGARAGIQSHSRVERSASRCQERNKAQRHTSAILQLSRFTTLCTGDMYGDRRCCAETRYCGWVQSFIDCRWRDIFCLPTAWRTLSFDIMASEVSDLTSVARSYGKRSRKCWIPDLRHSPIPLELYGTDFIFVP